MFKCPVCGATELSVAPYAHWPPPEGASLAPPYEDVLGLPSYEVCPNCGFEFGNDDNPGTATPVSFERYLEEWIESGSPRFDVAWKPALLISDSGLWLGRREGQWVVGRRSSRHPTDVRSEPISLLVLLDRDWSVAQIEVEELERDSPAMGPIPLTPTVQLALSGEASPHWGSKAVDWLKGGFPVEGMRAALERVAEDKRMPQRTRHDASQLLRINPESGPASD